MKGRQIIICALLFAIISLTLCHKPKEAQKSGKPAGKKSSESAPTRSSSAGVNTASLAKEEKVAVKEEIKNAETQTVSKVIIASEEKKHEDHHEHNHKHEGSIKIDPHHHHHGHDHSHPHSHEHHDHDHGSHHHHHKQELKSEEKTHQHDGHHHHHHDSLFQIKALDDIKKWLNKSLFQHLSKHNSNEQGFIGACIISLIPIPILILIVILGLRQNFLLKILSSLALGALLGDVLFHNLSEIFQSNVQIHFSTNGIINILLEKEMMIVYGIIFMILIEKLVPDFGGHSHDHVSGHVNNDKCATKPEEVANRSEIVVTFINDFTHNFTDGIAIAVSFAISLEIGVSTLVALILHEIPHEIADFTYLFRKKKSILWALFNQIFASTGCFFGVILSKQLIILNY